MLVTDYSCNNESRLGQNPETIYKFLLEPVNTYGIEFFKPIIIKQSSSLHNLPSLLQPTKPPSKYSSHFCNYISSNIRHTSLDILPSLLRVCAHLTASIVLLLTLCSNDNDGNRKCSSSIRYDWMDVYCNSNAYLMILAE